MVVRVADRAADLVVAHDELAGDVELDGLRVDRDDLKPPARAQRLQELVHDRGNAGGIERKVCAGPVGVCGDHGRQIFDRRINHDIRDARRCGLLAAGARHLADDCLHALGLEHGRDEQPDGASAANHGDLPGARAGMLDGVQCYGEGFDQCGLVERKVADGVHPPLLDDDVLAEAAAASRDADESHLLAEVVFAGFAGGAGAVDHERLNDDRIADRQPFDALTDRLDNA